MTDLTDLMRGEGEWRNIQPSVRKAFKAQNEIIQALQGQINTLMDSISGLKSQVASKLTKDEIELMLNCREKATHKFAKKTDLDRLQQELSDIKGELQRKANSRHVDECLRRKVDKISQIHTNPSSLSQNQDHFYELQLKSEQVLHRINETDNALQYCVRLDDLVLIKAQLDDVHGMVADFPNRDYIQRSLDNKIDRFDLDATLAAKVDVAQVTAMSTRMEKCLEEHERAITALRLKSDDSSVVNASIIAGCDWASMGVACDLESMADSGGVGRGRGKNGKSAKTGKENKKPNRKMGATRSRSRSRSASRSRKAELSSSHSDSDDSSTCGYPDLDFVSLPLQARRGPARTDGSARMGNERGELEWPGDNIAAGIAAGRVNAVISGMWKKLKLLAKAGACARKESKLFFARVQQLEDRLLKVAGIQQAEVLAVMLEEQKLRVDSIVLGSVKIAPTEDSLRRLCDDVGEIRAYLQLPQSRPLGSQLDEVGQLVDALGRRVGDIGTALGRAHLLIETMEGNAGQMELRLVVAENGVEKSAKCKEACIELDGRTRRLQKEITSLSVQLPEAVVSLTNELALQQARLTGWEDAAMHIAPLTCRVASLDSSLLQCERRVSAVEHRLIDLPRTSMASLHVHKGRLRSPTPSSTPPSSPSSTPSLSSTSGSTPSPADGARPLRTRSGSSAWRQVQQLAAQITREASSIAGEEILRPPGQQQNSVSKQFPVSSAAAVGHPTAAMSLARSNISNARIETSDGHGITTDPSVLLSSGDSGGFKPSVVSAISVARDGSRSEMVRAEALTKISSDRSAVPPSYTLSSDRSVLSTANDLHTGGWTDTVIDARLVELQVERERIRGLLIDKQSERHSSKSASQV